MEEAMSRKRKLAWEERSLLDQLSKKEDELLALQGDIRNVRQKLENCQEQSKETRLEIEKQITILMEIKSSIPIADVRRIIYEYTSSRLPTLVQGTRMVPLSILVPLNGANRGLQHFYELDMPFGEIPDHCKFTLKVKAIDEGCYFEVVFIHELGRYAHAAGYSRGDNTIFEGRWDGKRFHFGGIEFDLNNPPTRFPICNYTLSIQSCMPCNVEYKCTLNS